MLTNGCSHMAKYLVHLYAYPWNRVFDFAEGLIKFIQMIISLIIRNNFGLVSFKGKGSAISFPLPPSGQERCECQSYL